MKKTFAKVWGKVVAAGKYVYAIFTPPVDTVVERFLLEAAPYVDEALPVVQAIAKMTPTRVDDELVLAIAALGLNYKLDTSLPLEERGKVLHDLAYQALRRVLGPTPASSALNWAIETAVSILKRSK